MTSLADVAPISPTIFHSTDKIDQATSALAELQEEFTPPILLAALLRSSLADDLPTSPQATARSVVYVLREIVFSTNPQLEAEIMAIGCGVLDEKGIMSRIAEKRGVSREAISKRCRAFIREWGLPPPAVMKSEKACATYSIRNQPRT